jgi:hypothetical protein
MAMAKEKTPIDISNRPDVLRLAEEVARTGGARVLKRDSEEIAVLRPVSPAARRRRARARTAADWAAFRSAAGSWKDFDLDKFLSDIEESRRLSRPPVQL